MFKINISDKRGKSWKMELESEAFIGKELGSKIDGKEFSPSLNGYEFEITGASDKAGLTSMKNVEGIGIKRILLTYGKGMKKKPRREGKRKRTKNRPPGLRLRKSVRGKVLSADTTQINMKIVKAGEKALEEIFPEQNKPKEAPAASVQ
ncbi:30S ribosomal protein S6e [Candidatus Pacearchaeota archaeon]|nr:30S ribosomal protein S6e [Candidatus Pacearchaeota archaeon]